LNAVKLESFPAKRGNVSGGALVGGVGRVVTAAAGWDVLFPIAKMSEDSINDFLILKFRCGVVGCDVAITVTEVGLPQPHSDNDLSIVIHLKPPVCHGIPLLFRQKNRGGYTSGLDV
jgi:hypothetical protein